VGFLGSSVELEGGLDCSGRVTWSPFPVGEDEGFVQDYWRVGEPIAAKLSNKFFLSHAIHLW
jgi:hypothetical protein